MNQPEQQPGPLERLSQVHGAIQAITGIVAAGATVVGLVESNGGLIQVLVEVGFYSFACYTAAFLVVPIVLGLVTLLEQSTDRASTETAQIVIVGVALLGGGALIRFALFDPAVTEDLDGFGTAFAALMGVAFLCVPLVIWWYQSGSKPSNPPA